MNPVAVVIGAGFTVAGFGIVIVGALSFPVTGSYWWIAGLVPAIVGVATLTYLLNDHKHNNGAV